MLYWNEIHGYTWKEKEEYTGRYCGDNTNGNYWKYYWNQVSGDIRMRHMGTLGRRKMNTLGDIAGAILMVTTGNTIGTK